MSLIAKASGGSKFPILEAGSYPAMCYAIVDIGQQYNKTFNNYAQKVIFMWELPGEEIEIEGEMKPRAISETYTNSLGEKANLRKMLENWRGRAFTQEEMDGFDLRNVLGKACMISVVHGTKSDGSPYAKVGSVSKMPKGMSVPQKTTNALILFDLDAPDALENLQKLPEWVQNRIKESETYKEKMRPDASVVEARKDDFAVIDAAEDCPF